MIVVHAVPRQAEIIAITLDTVQASPFTTQVMVLSIITIVMTMAVYALVAGIVVKRLILTMD